MTSFVALAGSLLAIAVPVALAFSDVGNTTPYAPAIQALQEQGVIEGYSDGTFKPSSTVNRAEFLKIVLGSRGGTFTGDHCFPDVTDEWFASYVCTAKEEGIVGGYPDGLFKPDQTINFVEASKILSLAFKQQAQGSASVWYEPYVRALDSSKAIPPSIQGMDRPVTRGEMAEMMWRLTEGITDEPSLGYMNVKYPSLAVNLSKGVPQNATSCADLQAFAQEAQSSGNRNYGDGVLLQEGTALPSMAPTGANAEKAMDTSYSQTNVQVEGVDESDIVKTDGTYLYIMQEQKVRIVKAVPPEAMTLVGTIDLSDSVYAPLELYLEGDRLIVLGSGYHEPPYRIMQKMMPSIYPYYSSVQRTQVKIYSIVDKANPRLDRTVEFDGTLTSSRRIKDRLYLVMNQGMPWFGPRPVPLAEDVLPMFKDSALGEDDRPVARCGDVTILPPAPQPQYLIVAVVPLQSSTAEVKKEVVLGSADTVYASVDNLYVASGEWIYGWRGGFGTSEEKTNLYRFAFTDDGIALKAQGSVPGRILNQFSMDEYGKSFRIATTKGQMWDSSQPSTSNLYVLNFDLEQVGAVEGIAPGEQIYSVRFLGDRTYMVTFKKIDPFFVFDTSDPRNPKILGKLKIPGYSDYLHPYDATHILGFGKDAESSKEGDFAWYMGLKVALFDVTDPSDPKEMSRVIIGDRGSDSPLLSNHKALLFDRNRNLLAFPVSVAKVSDAAKQQGSWDFPAYGDAVFQGAYVFNVDLQDGITQRGTVTHYGADDFLKSGSYLYGKNVERIVRIGDSLFTIGQDGVKSVGEDTVAEEGKLNF